MSYSVHSRDYLRRARYCLDQQCHQYLFYAAFELRCGIEARMQEYLEPQEHVSTANKKEWRIAKLGKSIEAAFGTGEFIVEMAVHDSGSDRHIHTFYYVPVKSSLRKIGERLGDYLHVMRSARAAEDEWWASARSVMEDAYAELNQATRGNTIGAPLMQKGRTQLTVRADLLDEDTIQRLAILGKKVVMRVRYLAELPEKYPHPEGSSSAPSIDSPSLDC